MGYSTNMKFRRWNKKGEIAILTKAKPEEPWLVTIPDFDRDKKIEVLDGPLAGLDLMIKKGYYRTAI